MRHDSTSTKPHALVDADSAGELPLAGITHLVRNCCGMAAAGITCKEGAQLCLTALAGDPQDAWTPAIIMGSQLLLQQAEDTRHGAVVNPPGDMETILLSTELPRLRSFAGIVLQGPQGGVWGALWAADDYAEEADLRRNVITDCLRSAADQIEAMLVLQHNAAAAQRAAREQASFFELSQQMLAVVGIDGYTRRVNPALETATGFTQQELLSLPFTEFIHPEDREYMHSKLERFKEGEVNTGCEIRCRYKDGSYHWLSWAVSPILEEGVFYAVSHDVTAFRHTERDLRRSNADLERFAYIASHDLQEPLRMVASYVQLLAQRYKGKLDSDADDFIHFAVDGTQRMQKLIEDLLTYSRITKCGDGFALIDCGAALQQAMCNLAFAIQEQQAVITYDDLPTVRADYSQIAQLFQNILGNSLKFHSKEPPRIHVSVRRKDAEYIFCVRDNGIGIDPLYYDRVFTIFQRLHTSDQYPGTGIGLALCKRIIEGHQGRIWIEHVYAGGTALQFTLPVTHSV